MDLERFTQRVEIAARLRDGRPIVHNSIDQARVVCTQLFVIAQQSVRILAPTLTARLFGSDDVLKQAELFLANSSSHIEIVIAENDPMTRRRHPFFRRFSEHGNVSLRIARPSVATIINFSMVIADDDCYRFNSDEKNLMAVAVFGDADGARNLLRAFEQIRDGADPTEMVLRAHA